MEEQTVLGRDEDVCSSAWVSSGNEVEGPSLKKQEGLINKLMADRHGSPFEDGYFKFYIYAPRAVRDEHVRHRAGWSYSSSSLRYRTAEPVLYVPPIERPLRKAAGFKQIRPIYECLPQEDYERYTVALQAAYRATYDGMAALLADGFTETEALRWLTHDGLMTPYIARCNPRSLMHFLSLRTHDANANHVSYPMWEVNQVANQMEAVFAQAMPITHAAYVKHGRECP